MLKKFFIFSHQQKLRLRKNLFSQFSSVSSQIVLQLLFPPLMIFFWGVDNFGIWILITSIPATLTFLNLDFAHAATMKMIFFYERGQLRKVNEIFQNNLLMYIFNILLYSIVFFLAYSLLSLEKFTALEKLPIKELYLIIIFVFSSVYLNIFSNFLICGISYLGKLYVSTNVKALFEFILRLSVIAAGIFYDSLIYAGIIYFIIHIIKFFTFFYYFNKYNKILKFSLKLISRKIFKKLFILSIATTLENLTRIIKNNGKLLLIGIYFGPQIIAYISTCKTLFYFFPIRLILTTCLITYYEYAKLYSKRKFSEIKNFHKKHILVVLFLVITFVLLSLGIGKEVYNFWLNNKFDLTYIFLLVIILDASCVVLKEAVINTLKAINSFLKISVIETCFIIFSTIVSFYFLSLGYSFMVYFFIMLAQSFIVLIIAMFIVFKFSYNSK